jgi:NAD(P)-dependent dehydrogenase (short-subunit alcohol dehydrogenase family)
MYDYQAPSDLLNNRTIVVTGAGAGLGRAAAKAYAAHGATVILIGKTQSKLESCYDEIVAAGHPEPIIVVMDFATAAEGEYINLRDRLAETFGHIDGILLNASLLGERKPLEQTSLASWQSLMQVNVTAGFLLVKYLLVLCQQSPRDASIILTSSSVGRKGRAYWGAYAISKFATEGMMQVLADELENVSNVRVNSINPGATNTEMRRTAYPAERPTDNPSPDERMNAYLYLMGPDSIGVTGQACNAFG